MLVIFFMPISIFLFTGLIGTVPKELDETAYIDGSGGFGIFFKIVIPLLKPVTATVAVLIGCGPRPSSRMLSPSGCCRSCNKEGRCLFYLVLVRPRVVDRASGSTCVCTRSLRIACTTASGCSGCTKCPAPARQLDACLSERDASEQADALISRAFFSFQTHCATKAPGTTTSQRAFPLSSINGSALGRPPLPLGTGTFWTTDAPLREIAAAIRRACKLGAGCVEMEVAALYASHALGGGIFLASLILSIPWLSGGEDFEKGPESGAPDSLKPLDFILRVLRRGSLT
jgi:hypothetical protein